MICDLAQGEIDRLAALGIALTPDEIVTLNAYAVRGMRTKGASAVVYAQRAVNYGGVLFVEPTIGHLRFLRDAESIIDLGGESGYIFRAFVCCTPLKALPDIRDVAAIKAAVAAFASRIVHLSPRHVVAAISYVSFGDFPTPSLRPDEADDFSPYSARDWVIESVVNGLPHATGITLDDALNMTYPQFAAHIRAAEGKSSSSFDDFFAYVTRIEEDYANGRR